MKQRYVTYSWHPHSLNFAKEMCDRMNREVEVSTAQMSAVESRRRKEV